MSGVRGVGVLQRPAPASAKSSLGGSKKGAGGDGEEDEDASGEGGGWDPHFKPAAASATAARFANQVALTPLQLLEKAALERAAAETGPSAAHPAARSLPRAARDTPGFLLPRRAPRSRRRATTLVASTARRSRPRDRRRHLGPAVRRLAGHAERAAAPGGRARHVRPLLARRCAARGRAAHSHTAQHPYGAPHPQRGRCACAITQLPALSPLASGLTRAAAAAPCLSARALARALLSPPHRALLGCRLRGRQRARVQDGHRPRGARVHPQARAPRSGPAPLRTRTLP